MSRSLADPVVASAAPTAIGRLCRHAAIVLAALVASPPTARGDAGDLTGIDAIQQGQANPVALGGGPSGAVLGNPALLVDGPPQRSAGLAGIWERARVHLAARPDGADVSSAIYSARRADGSAIPHAPATADLVPRGDTSGGDPEAGLWAVSVSRIGLVSFAALAYLPLPAPLQSTWYADEREAPFRNAVQPALVRDDRGATILALAIAWAPRPWLALGLGAKVLIGARPRTQVYSPDPLVNDSSNLNLETRLTPDVAPVLGARSRWGALVVAASARPAHALTTEGASVVQLWTDGRDDDTNGEIAQALDFVYDYQPARVALSAGTRLRASDLTAEAVFRRWSRYVDHHGEAPSGFRDTVELGVTGAWPLAEGRLVAGARWLPSPVPPQTGRSNYADTDRVVLAAGGALPCVLAGRSVRLAIGLQAQWLRPRTTYKDLAAEDPIVDEFPDAIDLAGDPIAASDGLQSNNPGYPGFTIDGWILAGSVTATWEM